MKKLAIFALLAITCILLLSSCQGDADTPAGMKLASDTELVDYYLYVPTDWQTDMSTGITSAYASTADLSNVSVTSGFTEESTLKEFWDNTKATFDSTFDEFTVIEEGAEATLGGLAAARYNYTAVYEGEEYQFLQYITVKGSQVYILTYTAKNTKSEELGYVPFEKNLDQVLTIVEEFRFK